jgi:hypothetical protein
LDTPQLKPLTAQSAQATEPCLVKVFDHQAIGAMTRPSV